MVPRRLIILSSWNSPTCGNKQRFSGCWLLLCVVPMTTTPYPHLRWVQMAIPSGRWIGIHTYVVPQTAVQEQKLYERKDFYISHTLFLTRPTSSTVVCTRCCCWCLWLQITESNVCHGSGLVWCDCGNWKEVVEMDQISLLFEWSPSSQTFTYAWVGY